MELDHLDSEITEEMGNRPCIFIITIRIQKIEITDTVPCTRIGKIGSSKRKITSKGIDR